MGDLEEKRVNGYGRFLKLNECDHWNSCWSGHHFWTYCGCAQAAPTTLTILITQAVRFIAAISLTCSPSVQLVLFAREWFAASDTHSVALIYAAIVLPIIGIALAFFATPLGRTDYTEAQPEQRETSE